MAETAEEAETETATADAETESKTATDAETEAKTATDAETEAETATDAETRIKDSNRSRMQKDKETGSLLAPEKYVLFYTKKLYMKKKIYIQNI